MCLCLSFFPTPARVSETRKTRPDIVCCFVHCSFLTSCSSPVASGRKKLVGETDTNEWGKNEKTRRESIKHKT